MVCAIIFFILLILPSLLSGFHSDDYFQLLLLRDNGLLDRQSDGSLFGLFSFIDADLAHRQQLQLYGVIPWLAADDFYFRFWRPLTEVTHYIDFSLLPEQAWFAHLHSGVWYLLLSYCVYRLAYECNQQRKEVAVLAWLIFLFDGQHVANIGWIANRNALVASVFGLMCLLLFVEWHKRKQYRFYFLSVLFFAVAILSAEMALGICAYLFFYAYCVQKASFVRLLKQSSLYVLVLLLWFFSYQYFNFGVNTSSGLYLHPYHELLDYISALAVRLPVYISASLLPFPAGFSWVAESMVKGAQEIIVMFCVSAVGIFIYSINKLKCLDNHGYFLLYGSIFCLIPVCSTMPQDRLALLQTVGADIVIAMLIFYMMEKSKHRMYQSLVIVLLVIHLVLSPLHLLLGSWYLSWASENIENNALSLDKVNAEKVVVVIRAPIGEAVSLVGIRAVSNQDIPKQFFWLANDEFPVSIQQESENTLIAVKREGFGKGLESAFRSVNKQPFELGEKIKMGEITVEVLALSSEHYPQQLRLIFEKNLDTQHYQFYSYKENRFEPVSLAELVSDYR